MEFKFASLVVILTFCVCYSAEVDNERHRVLPIVLWHGMGDTCCGRRSVGRIKTFLEDNYGIRKTDIEVAIGSRDFCS